MYCSLSHFYLVNQFYLQTKQINLPKTETSYSAWLTENKKLLNQYIDKKYKKVIRELVMLIKQCLISLFLKVLIKDF